jgi:type 1 fimbria pilin
MTVALSFAPGHLVYAANISVTGTVLTAPCDINVNDVDFGRVNISRIDGNNYQKTPISYTVSCDDTLSPTTLKLLVKGSPATFGSGLLATDKKGLAIQFMNSDGNIIVNSTELNFNYGSPLPTIAAVLDTDSSTSLEAGMFTATAILNVEYQ